MKTGLGLVVVSLVVLLGCDGDSTEPASSDSRISATGDITESWDATAYFGTSTWSSFDEEKEYFSVVLIPESPGANPLAAALLFKFDPQVPGLGTYSIAEYALGDDIPANEFGGGYSGRNVTDLSGYTMTSGSVTFSEVTQSRVRGSFEMSGYYRDQSASDPSRVAHVSGQFNATPVPGGS